MHVPADRRILVATTVAALGVSLAGKFLTDALLTTHVPLLGTFFGLTPAHNPGIAFGLTFPPIIQVFLITIALLLVLMAAFREGNTPLMQGGFGLILGGALGNLVDRASDGQVTDMIQVGTFPVFNLADSCITIGVILVLLLSFRLR